MIVVDDQLLFGILARKPSLAFEALASNGVATTSSWYFRLARAIATGRAEGSLSRLMNDLNEPERQIVRTSLGTLPPSVETLTPRVVVPLMAAIASATIANFLTLEALAVAIALDATIAIHVVGPRRRPLTAPPPRARDDPSRGRSSTQSGPRTP